MNGLMIVYGRSKYIKYTAMLFGLTIFALGSRSFAEQQTKSWQVHGFASQAFISTSNNDFFGTSSDNGSFGFTEVGLNASIRPTATLQAAGQLLSRRAGIGNSGDIQIDYLLADYRPISREQLDIGFRIGRIKNPLGLYNETRDVAFTRPSLILPQSIYFDRTRNIALSADGLNIYNETRTSFGDFDFQLEAAYPVVDDLDTKLSLVRTFEGTLQGELSYLGRIMYTYKEGRARIAYSGAQVNIDLVPKITSANSDEAIKFYPSILSAQYNAEKWEMVGEYAKRRIVLEDYGSPGTRYITGESYYIQTTYHINNIWDLLVRYDVAYINKDDREGTKYEAAFREPAHTQFAKDLTFGIGWNPWRNWMFRAEYHIINGTAWLPIQDNPAPKETEQYWNMFGILLSYRF